MQASGTALSKLESRLDAVPCHAVGQSRRWLRAIRRRREATQPVAALHGSGALELRAALEHAMGRGALEAAEGLYERLLHHGTRQCELGTLLALLEGSLLLGRGGEVVDAAARRRHELRSNVRGATLLTLFGLHAPSWLPDGRPNLLGWSRRIASGELVAEDLAQLMIGRRGRWLLSADFQLPFFSALWREHPARAVRFLNRYLALSGVSESVELAPRRDDRSSVLAELRATALPERAGPLVSVVVAAYNAQETLAHALDSLLAQTHGSLELLVGDDASTDQTSSIMARYATNPRVRLFSSARRQGAYNLRNALARQARGELLTFHDADDFALSSRIERQVATLRASGARAVVTSLLRVRPNGSVVFFKNQAATRLSRVSLLVHRSAFEAAGAFRRARVGADEELQARLRERFGAEAIHRLALPLNFSLWSQTSATRELGSESLEDGYRSPSRRAYSELIYRRFVVGEAISDEAFDRRLRETGNYSEPCELREGLLSSAASSPPRRSPEVA